MPGNSEGMAELVRCRRRQTLRQLGTRDVRPDIHLDCRRLQNTPGAGLQCRFPGLGQPDRIRDRRDGDGDVGLRRIGDDRVADDPACGGGPASETRLDQAVDAEGAAVLRPCRDIVCEIHPYRQRRPVVESNFGGIVWGKLYQIGLVARSCGTPASPAASPATCRDCSAQQGSGE